jgi:iron complex outermembrane receptor protein
MMETVLSRSIRLICAGGIALGMQVAYAQEAAPENVQRVEITGSSIKRIAAEASLPVQTFNQKDIVRSGVTSVTDFIQQLPVMQGFTVAADSVGGGGGGITTASIHDVGSQYTLVLLNGRRIAPATSGTTIDVNSIPLSAVERIEVLTDGASALYGADAIAGVVNFILKKGASPLTVDAKYTKAQHPGAGGANVSMSKGWGDLDANGYTLFLSASHQEEARLAASQRGFSKTGIINFPNPNKPSENLQFFNGSSRSIPPNVTINYNRRNADGTFALAADGSKRTANVNVNPYLQINKKCAPAHVDLGDGQCYFDYTTTVEIAPEIRRDGLYASGQVKLGNSGFKAFADVAYNDAHIYANIAPYPAEFSLAKTSPLFAKYVAPYITAQQVADMNTATVKYRLLDMGGRAYDYASQTTHIVAGIEGAAMGWDLNSAITSSKNKAPTNYVGGFPLAAKFNAAVAAGTIDPFPYAKGEMPAAMVDALKATQYVGNFSNTIIKMDGWDGRASRELFAVGGGSAAIAVGADWRETRYTQSGNPAVSHSEILFDDDQPSFDLKRNNSGLFSELVAPLTKELEVSGAIRYDRIGSVTDGIAKKTFGSTESASTYKVSARFQPTKTMLFRAAYGTGFKAATMQQIAQPQTDFGVTGGTYTCPITAANGLGSHPLAKYCDGAGKNQFEAFNGGNPNLKPEKSKQWSMGAVFEPTGSFSAKLDLWNVQISDAVTSVSEALIFQFPQKYISLYTTKSKASTGTSSLAIIFAPINIGKQENQGIDYDFLLKGNVLGGKITGRLAGTYLLKSRYTTPGTDDQWETSMNQYGSNDAVSFKNVIKTSVSYDTTNWGHTLTANYRNGYKDKHHDIDNCAVSIGDALGDCIDVQLNVKAYTTLDWQTQWHVLKGMELIAGVTNMLDKTPPLSLRNTGSHQLGYDPRYASPVGRSFYLQGSYKF